MPQGTKVRSRYALRTILLAAAFFLAFVLFVELGRRIGLHQLQVDGEGARAGVGVIDGAVFGLLSLLLGFSFNGAAGRFDKRRELVSLQVSTIARAWQRIDTLPSDQQQAVRPLFLRYVDALLDYYRDAPGTDALRETAALGSAGSVLWTRAVTVCVTSEGEKARMLLLPSISEMFSAVEKERLARRIHPARIIFVMLTVTALAAALFGGYEMSNAATRNWLYIIGVALAISFAVYVIVELEYPRLGLIRIDAMDHALVELRETLS